MPERRQAPSSSTTTTRGASVRRNLFHQHLSRRPTTSSTSTSAETLRLDIEPEAGTSDIVIRDKNGDVQFCDPPLQSLDEQEDDASGDGHDKEKERQRLADAVRHHQRDRNRAPSEPAELLEAVKSSLRSKVMALSEDNWMYEAEEDNITR